MKENIKVKDFFEEKLLNKKCKQCGKSHDRRSDFCSEKCHQKWYYEQNKEKLLKKHIQWQKDNKEKSNQQSKKWYENNKKYFQEYYKKHKAEV